MGRWGWRGAQPEPREKLRVSRSDSYSDDYRITPELIHSDTGKNGHKMIRDVHKRHNHDCCSQDERCCYEGAPCCSQDERYYHVGAPRAYGPRKGRRSSSTGALSPRRRAMGGLEVVVVDEGRVDLRRQAPCTSCESCDTCDNYTSESVTRIELKNNLFTSPMHTAEFYDSPDSPYAYFDQHLSPVRGRESSPLRGRSPHRRLTHSDGSGGRRHLNTTGRPMSDGTGIHTRPSSRLPRSHGNTHKASMSPSRMPKMNATNRAPTARRTATTARDSSRGRPLHRTNHANGHDPTVGRLPSIVDSQNDLQVQDHVIETTHYRKSASPDRKNAPPSDLQGGGRIPGSGGPGPGGGPGGGGGDTERGGGGGSGGGGHKEEAGKVSMTLSKRDLLNQMVCQTKQHRQQIRSLENELERLRAGDVLNKCEVSVSEVEWRPADVVGEGSFSTVYKGTYCGTEVAVKELKFKLSQDDKNYFRSEAALLQQLHHPRIVLLMGVCTGSARPFMLLEYLAGGTLYNLIHNTTCEKLDHAAYFVVAKDIAQGMNYLHRHDPQVLHLDLKSMNVLLDSYTRAKIADFGFSILRRSRSASPTQQRGSIRGTPAWMAPELLCKGEVSAKCDVYSYAIILWEMLTSSHPFKGLDIFQIMERTEAGGRPTLPVSRMSRELKELITSCWAQNPSLRPSFEEILGALESAAVPSSWRGLLQKANVKSSLLSDVAAARTIISVVEQSVELVRRSLQQQRASKNKDKKSRSSGDNETDQHIYETIDTLGVTDPEILQRYQRKSRGGPSSRNASGQDYPNHASPFQRSSPSRQPYPRDASRKGQNKKDRTREFSPQKEGRRSISKTSRPQSDMKRRSGSRDIRERKIEEGNRDRSRQKRKDKHSEDIVRRRADRASPEKMDRVNDRKRNSREKREQGRKPDNSKSRSKKSREYEHYEHQKNRDHKNPSSRGKKEPKQVYDRRNESSKQRYSKKKRSRSLESVVRYTDFRTDVRGLDRHYRGGHERLSDISREKNHRKNYVRERTSSEEERGHGSKQRPNKHRLADSRDSLGESQNESWTSIECSSYEGSNNSVEFDDYGIGKEPLRYSPSPRRRSPTRHFSPTRRNQGSHAPDRQQNAAYNYSLERRRSPRSPQRKRAASGSRFGPLVVTSEQLMTQKQRLRPVRPSELSDLSQMPETSLNDISLILKTAITKRRNAFDEGLSGRDSFRSDIEWSDWH